MPESKKLIPREQKVQQIAKLLPVKEAVILTGVRRGGKSTLIYQVIDYLLRKGTSPENILYFNFDEPLEEKTVKTINDVHDAYRQLKNPKGRVYLFFDEIQNIPQWEQWVKKHYDLHGKNMKFILTGSNATMLSEDMAKLLTGRIFTITVSPLSFREFLIFNNIEIRDFDVQRNELMHYLEKYLTKGGFPEVVLEKDDDINTQRLREYFDSILLRDVVTSRNIRETAKLRDLAGYTLANISSLLSYNKISKAIGLNINTLAEYLHYLETSYLLFQVRFFSYSVKESSLQQKPRKIYTVDNGLRNAVAFTFSKDMGKLAENLAYLCLKRAYGIIYYWKGHGEVDFVVKHRDQRLTAINVTTGKTIPEREILALLEFKRRFKRTKELILLTGDIEKIERGIAFVPLWKWVLQGAG